MKLMFLRRFQVERNVFDFEHLVARWEQYSYLNLYSKSYLATCVDN